MLIFGGFILDKMGVRFTGIGASLTMLVGTVFQYIAIAQVFPMEGEILGIKTQIAIGALGFGIFGVGVEVAGITVSKIIVKWFKGKEMALAMGLEMATARMGTALALAIPAPMAIALGVNGIPNVSAPVMLGLGLLVAGFLAFVWYTFKDKKLDREDKSAAVGSDEEAFRIRDVLFIITNRGFWLIAMLCVLFYSGVFPFLYFAADLMVNKYGVDPKFAVSIPALLTFERLFLHHCLETSTTVKGKGLPSCCLVLLCFWWYIPSFQYPLLTVQWWLLF